MGKKKTWIKRIFAVCMILCLLTAGAAAAYLKIRDVPVKIQYKLSELSEDQAVMVVCSYLNTDSYFTYFYVVINKKGYYKYILKDDLDKLAKNLNFDTSDFYNTVYPNIDIYDTILQMEEIPYQKERIWLNPYFLQRAINLKDVKLPVVFSCVGSIAMSYRVVCGVEDRELVIYRDSESNCDYEVPTYRYMLDTMKKYDDMVKEKIEAAMQEK